MQNQMHRALLIDDEPDARAVLRRLIERFCPHLELCAEAGTVPEALEAIQRCRPAVVFLDVDLRQGSGFDILDAFPRPDFKVVFITAYDHFAVKAFKYRALHYLLKPIDPQDLIAATAELNAPQQYWPEYALLQQSLRLETASRISLPTINGSLLLSADEIVYASADDKYLRLVLESGEKVFIGCSMKELEARLPAAGFIRPHQSYLVRLDAIRKVIKSENVTLILKDQTEVPVSRRNRDQVLRFLKQ